MSKEDFQALLLATLQNSIAIVSFIILAINFQKWWVSLFSLLFLQKWTYSTNNEDDEE